GRRCLLHLERISIIPIVEIPENTVPRTRCEYDRILSRAPVDERHIPESEEERLVFDYRPAVAARQLMRVGPIRLRGLPCSRSGIHLLVVVPRVGIKSTVSAKPHGRSAKLIRTGACKKLKLCIAASHFSINGRDDNPDFADKVRTHIR